MEGATNEATWTVTRKLLSLPHGYWNLNLSHMPPESTSIGASATFSVEMAIPKVAKVSGGVSITAEVTNETGTRYYLFPPHYCCFGWDPNLPSSFKTSVNNQVTQELSYDSVPGKECSASVYKNYTCHGWSTDWITMRFIDDDQNLQLEWPRKSSHGG